MLQRLRSRNYIPFAASIQSWGGDLLRYLEREGDLMGLFGNLMGDLDLLDDLGDFLCGLGDLLGDLFGDLFGDFLGELTSDLEW